MNHLFLSMTGLPKKYFYSNCDTLMFDSTCAETKVQSYDKPISLIFSLTKGRNDMCKWCSSESVIRGHHIYVPDQIGTLSQVGTSSYMAYAM